MKELPVHFHPAFGFTIIVVAVAIAGLGVYTGGLHLVVVGVAQTALGHFLAANPIAVVFSDRVEVRALLGATVKTLPIAGLHELRLDRSRLVVPDGTGTHAIGGPFSYGKDLAELRSAIEAATAATHTGL